MSSPAVSLLLAALAVAWLLCAATAQPNATSTPQTTNTSAANTSAPTVAGGPVPAHPWGGQSTVAQPIDFTTGNPATLAFVHLSFGINVWNPQMTVPMFNKPGIKAMFAQSIKNAVPDAVVVSEALPATKGILVRSTVRFQADAAGARAQADALVKYLTEASLLKQMLPEANWHPVLVYTTFPYLASAVVYPVGPAADRVSGLHFTLRVPGINKATFDAKKLAAWKAALVAALPGLTNQGITALTTESTELGGRNYYARTDTLVHTQVTGPTLQALRLFSPKLLHKPNTIWSRYTFGAVEAVPRSWLVVAFAAPCKVLYCSAYSPGTCTCTACQAGWQLRAGTCTSVNTATLSATDPQFVQKARTIGKRQRLVVTNYVLEGESQPSTLNLKRVEVWRPNAKVVIMTPSGPVTRGPPDTRMFRGTIAGSPGSVAVLTVRQGGGVSGLALRDKASWMLGKVGKSSAISAAQLSSRKTRPGARIPRLIADDVRHAARDSRKSAAAAVPSTTRNTFPATADTGGLLQTVFDQPHKAVIAIDTDNEYCGQFATEADAIDYAADLIGYADVVYSREIQTDMIIGFVRLWQKHVKSPYSAPKTDGMLDQLKATWDATQKTTTRTFTLLMSGKIDSDGGLSFSGQLCDAFRSPADNQAYGVVGDIGTGFKWNEQQADNPNQTVWEAIVVLHEIGHLFNAPHTHDACGLKGVASTVDDCIPSAKSYEEANPGSGESLVPIWKLWPLWPPVYKPCPQPGVTFVNENGVLPTCNPQQSPVWNGGRGTIMSYCHFLAGQYDNIAFTFGSGQTNCPNSPGRITQLMQEHVRARAALYPKCFAARPQDWWGWKLMLATGVYGGSGADIQVRWSCGSTEATHGFIPLTRGDQKLCGTSSYARVTPPEGADKPQQCFARQTREQFTVEFYPDNTPSEGWLLPENKPSVEACTAAGVKPVLTVAFAGSVPWDLDTTKLALELHYVASDVENNRLQARSKTFRLCGTGAVQTFPKSDTLTYRTFQLCASEGTCQLFDGSIFKCNEQAYLVENGKLRLFSAQAYASWGSPAPDVSAIGDCLPASSTHNCPAGTPMPLKPVISPCSGLPTYTPCKSLSTNCCACRKTKADGKTAAYASVVAATPYAFGPACSQRLAWLPASTPVAYTGAKLPAHKDASTGCTAPQDYAQIVVQLGGQLQTAWVDAKDLVFCDANRKCGNKVELGARCDDNAVKCCDNEDEGGHPKATCSSPGPGAPTICRVPAGAVPHCESSDCPECVGKRGQLCTGFPANIQVEDTVGVCSDGKSGCLNCDFDGCPQGYKCLKRLTYGSCFPNSYVVPPPGPDGIVYCSDRDCPGCYVEVGKNEPRLCKGPGSIFSFTGGPELIGVCGYSDQEGCWSCDAEHPCLSGYSCPNDQDCNKN